MSNWGNTYTGELISRLQEIIEMEGGSLYIEFQQGVWSAQLKLTPPNKRFTRKDKVLSAALAGIFDEWQRR